MDFDLVIQNGTVITADKTVQTEIGVKDGKIAALGSGLRGHEQVSAAGMWVIPGGVDPHVHFEMPTPTTVTSDDWNTGTKAAAYGGTTTVIDFVEPENDQTLLEALALRRAQADGRTHIDYSLRMTLTNAAPTTLAQIPAVMTAGISSFKLYTTYTGFALPDESLLAAFEAVGAAGGLAMVHCENDAIVQHSLAKLRAEGRLAPQFQPQSRPFQPTKARKRSSAPASTGRWFMAKLARNTCSLLKLTIKTPTRAKASSSSAPRPCEKSKTSKPCGRACKAADCKPLAPTTAPSTWKDKRTAVWKTLPIAPAACPVLNHGWPCSTPSASAQAG